MYAVEMEVEVEWMGEVSLGYPNLLSTVCFIVYSE